jgi:hypothetical protein
LGDEGGDVSLLVDASMVLEGGIFKSELGIFTGELDADEL